jgi:long-chain acyl-CoA synthetase
MPCQSRWNKATLSKLFAWRVAQTPRGNAYLQFDAACKSRRPVSWKAFAERVGSVTGAMAQLQLQPGVRVALLLNNGLSAVCVDQAALALACAPVPMPALENPVSVAYVLPTAKPNYW